MRFARMPGCLADSNWLSSSSLLRTSDPAMGMCVIGSFQGRLNKHTIQPMSSASVSMLLTCPPVTFEGNLQWTHVDLKQSECAGEGDLIGDTMHFSTERLPEPQL